MALLRRLRVLVRSRSPQFARDYVEGPQVAPEIGAVKWWNGDGKDVFYRKGSSDRGLIYGILFKRGARSEYWLPREVPHGTILDIGANIGITSRFLGHLFPDAVIHSFEPIPGNVEMLRRNTACNTRIHVHPYGLSDRSGIFPVHIPTDDKTNMGMFSLHSEAREGQRIDVPIRAVPEVIRDLGLSKVDIIKIDTEGAEYEILKAFPPELLADVKWIYGELHQQGLEKKRDFAVLDYLSPWFAIDVFKPLHKQNYGFDACNRRIAKDFIGFRRVRSKARF